jgi:hypothetical protein
MLRVVLTTARSLIAELRPIVTAFRSPRTTAPYQMELSESMPTRPTTVALGATKTSFSTTGNLSNKFMTVRWRLKGSLNTGFSSTRNPGRAGAQRDGKRTSSQEAGDLQRQRHLSVGATALTNALQRLPRFPDGGAHLERGALENHFENYCEYQCVQCATPQNSESNES